jgi:hypothetical protein
MPAQPLHQKNRQILYCMLIDSLRFFTMCAQIFEIENYFEGSVNVLRGGLTLIASCGTAKKAIKAEEHRNIGRSSIECDLNQKR